MPAESSGVNLFLADSSLGEGESNLLIATFTSSFWTEGAHSVGGGGSSEVVTSTTDAVSPNKLTIPMLSTTTMILPSSLPLRRCLSFVGSPSDSVCLEASGFPASLILDGGEGCKSQEPLFLCSTLWSSLLSRILS